MMDEVHVYMCFHIASIKSTAGSKTSFFPSPFFISTTWFLILAKARRNDHVAACTTSLHSATEKNEICGYISVPCMSKMTQRSSTVDWFSFSWRHQIGCDGRHTEQIFTFKVTLCINSCNRFRKLVDTVSLDLNYCTSPLKKVDIYTDKLN